MFSLGLFALASVIPSVFGHGYITQVQTVSPAATWPGWDPNVDPYLSPTPSRIVRKIPGNGPVTDLSLIDVQCNGYTDGGFYTAPAASVAPVAAGSQVKLTWTTWPDSHLGPMITYMAKVAQSGKASDGTWAAPTALLAAGSVYTFTIPSTLAPGQYLIRHEIIALHAAYTYPGAQVYPSCAQVQVTGSGTKTPSGSYLVSFPGAYTGSTPGIVYDVYTNTSAYPIPGPAVWTGA